MKPPLNRDLSCRYTTNSFLCRLRNCHTRPLHSRLMNTGGSFPDIPERNAVANNRWDSSRWPFFTESWCGPICAVCHNFPDYPIRRTESYSSQTWTLDFGLWMLDTNIAYYAYQVLFHGYRFVLPPPLPTFPATGDDFVYTPLPSLRARGGR